MAEVTAPYIMGPTGLGTGVTRVQLGGASWKTPTWARTLLKVKPVATLDTPTAAESCIPELEIESNDIPVAPFQCFGSPTGAILGASGGGGSTGPNQSYDVNCPLKGGDNVDFYMKSLDANTSQPFGEVEVTYTNLTLGELGLVQRHAKTGTTTSTGTTASVDVVGTPYSFSAASRIVELMATFGHSTVATADGVLGYIKFTSTDLQDAQDLRMALEPVAGGLATLQVTHIPRATRQAVSVPCIANNVTIQDAFYAIALPGTAGAFKTGVVYEVL